MAGDEGSEVPVWVRGSVFMDYGQLYDIDFSGRFDYWARVLVSLPI